MAIGEVILRFNKVSFAFGNKHILNEVDFSVREGSKITLMGQNGAGKSTIFGLITGGHKSEVGAINIRGGTTLATAKQVIPREFMDSTVQEFFESAFTKKVYDITPRMKKVMDVVHLVVPHDKKLNDLSGGQQARLLLAQALIQNPDVLLLDEPTNNLDKYGILHLTKFLKEYSKTVIVISHDADFLNSFTHGVLYLDVYTHKVEQYMGDYLKVVEEIKLRIERERTLNARLAAEITHRKEQAGFFAQKGGHMRDVARKMKEKITELEGDVVDLRQEDKTIRSFAIPCQEELSGRLLELKSVSIMNLSAKGGSASGGKTSKPVAKKVNVQLKKKERLLLSGPNGIGKTTLLESLASGHAKGEHVTPGVKIGYYRQDFSTLDFDQTVFKALADSMDDNGTEQQLRSCAAGFLLDAEILKTKIGLLSEGQKGLVAFAKLTLERPGLLILDEPTNHINFRHIPVIAKALDRYEGAMILVSHVPDFVSQIKIDYTLDLEAL
ncbi:MAG: ATP-binding cassette domain-containing protein [bacterium]|nr:ATP-binding cassette domain-containing protein [bacterium]